MKTKELFGSALLLCMLLTGCSKSEKPKYDYDYLAVQMSKGDDWSIIDKNGKEVVKEEYPADALLSDIVDRVFWVKQGERYQLFSIDQPKKPLIEEEFKQATPFVAGRAVVSNIDQPIRILDTKGNTVATLPKDISRCLLFTDEGYAVVHNSEGLMGLIDAQGKIVMKPTYSWLSYYSEGILLAIDSTTTNFFSILNLKGEKLGEIDYTKYVCHGFYEGKALVVAGEGEEQYVSAIDKTGKKLFDLKKAQKVIGQFMGGYFVFANGDGKMGVADDKGDIVIRAKYDGLQNLGNGLFSALKGNKCGIVDVNDETVLPFDYTDGTNYTLGGKFIMKDGTDWMLVNREGKEIITFHENGRVGNMCNYAEFIDISGLVGDLMKQIERSEQAQTAGTVAAEAGLQPEFCEYRRDVETSMTIGGKLQVDCRTWFAEPMAEEKTHVETVDDGWFTEEHTVSDGYQWKDILPSAVFLEFTLTDMGISVTDFYNTLLEKLAEGRTKQSEQQFVKTVSAKGQKRNCLTEVMRNDDHIIINLQFQEP